MKEIPSSIKDSITKTYFDLYYYLYFLFPHLENDIAGFIKKGWKGLDLGCGYGYKTDKIAEAFDCEMVGIDPFVKPLTDINFIKSPGHKLPFKDNEFDFVYVAFVLHHTPDPKKVLEEAKRVSKKYIFVYEDAKENWLDKHMSKIHVGFLNRSLKSYRDWQPKREEEWLELFDKSGLKTVQVKNKPRIYSPIYPVSRRVFILQA